MAFKIISAASFELGVFAQKTEIDCFEFGIGVLKATQNITKLTPELTGHDIVFVGSAGHFYSYESPKIYLINEVSWLPTCERLGKSYQAGAKAPKLNLKSHEIFADLRLTNCICAPNISLISDIGTEFSKLDTLENIELYACARVLLPVVNSFSAILVTTNKVGINAHQEWKQNHKIAADDLAKYLLTKNF